MALALGLPRSFFRVGEEVKRGGSLRRVRNLNVAATNYKSFLGTICKSVES